MGRRRRAPEVYCDPVTGSVERVKVREARLLDAAARLFEAVLVREGLDLVRFAEHRAVGAW